MHAAAKILLGLIIIAAGFGLFLDSPSIGMWESVTGINWWSNFVIAVTGVIPAFLILVGLFVVWLEADEIKAEKEMEADDTDTVQEVKKAVTPKKPAPKTVKKKK